MASLELFTDKDIERLEKVKQLLQDIKELDIGFKLSNVIEADKDTTLLFSCGLIREQDKKSIEVELTDKLQIHCVVLPVNTMLEKGIKQYIVTNGVASTQHKKLRDSKFFDIIDGLFISDEIGSPKPSNAFFDAVFENIPPFKKDEIIIIGDSLTSDIKGGNNAEILCCWYNIANEKNTDNLKIDYEIKNLWEILKILELD